MPKPILTAAQWNEVQVSACALGSIKAAAERHGVSYAAARKRAERDQWPVPGSPSLALRVKAHREEAEAAGVASVSQAVTTRAMLSPARVVAEDLAETGRKTRALLATGLLHAAGQVRRTRHPLAKARAIRDVASAAATVHPAEFGAGLGARGGSQQDASILIQQAIVQVFGKGPAAWGYGSMAPQLEDTGEQD